MISVPLRTRRQQKAQLAQKVQHAVPSFVLLGDGWARITGGEDGQGLLLGAVEVIAAGLVIGTVARGVIRIRSGTPKGLPPPTEGGAEGLPAEAHRAKAGHGVDWIDICIGGMLIVEAYMHYHETGRIKGPTLLLAAVMSGLGLFHGRMTAFAHKRRSMHVSADGISIPGRLPFMRITLPWADVAGVEIDGDTARIVANDGRSRLVDCTDAIDRDAVRQAILAAKTHYDQFKAAQALQKNETPA